MISIREMKFDDMTVTRQSIKPRKPTITRAEMVQHDKGRIIQRSFLKKKKRAKIKKHKTQKPNTTRSCSIKLIMSATIMGTPPKNISALFLCLSMIWRTASISCRCLSIAMAWYSLNFLITSFNSSDSSTVSPDSSFLSLSRVRLFKREKYVSSRLKITCRAVVFPSRLTRS